MQQDTNTIAQSVIDYFNISKFCMNKIRKLAMKFSYLILRKIVKIVATRGQILRQNAPKFVFGWGSAPDPARELIALPQTSQLEFRGHISKGGGGKGREEEGRGSKGRGEGEGNPQGLVDNPHVPNPEKYPVCLMFTSSPLRMQWK